MGNTVDILVALFLTFWLILSISVLILPDFRNVVFDVLGITEKDKAASQPTDEDTTVTFEFGTRDGQRYVVSSQKRGQMTAKGPVFVLSWYNAGLIVLKNETTGAIDTQDADVTQVTYEIDIAQWSYLRNES